MDMDEKYSLRAENINMDESDPVKAEELLA